MKINLDTPSPDMDAEQSGIISRDNVAALRKTMNKTGVNSLLLVQRSTAFNVTGATLHVPENFEGIVTSSGGFFDIEFKTSYRMPAAGNLLAVLYIDDKEMDSIYCGLSNPQVIIWPIYLRFRGALGEGRHKIQVKIALDSGTGVFGDTNTVTRLQAVETVL